ncbi:MAG: tryptophan-rich sensory protein [Deltaproteobacteria bacterium]|nr:tryptophan-rich sensory protein [Deltaproteobacteria bacterium]
MTRYMNPQARKKIFKLVLSIAACLSAGVMGSFFTAQSVDSWYPLIRKPPISPPDWVFAPVWTVLYILMGVSFFLIWIHKFENRQLKNTLTIFIFQLLLNILWSVVFFGFHSIIGGLVVVILLFGAILWTMKTFSIFSKAAAILLVPYIIWVGLALVLNLWIFLIN